MKVIVLGENYTGAHFRMFRDPLDGHVCQLTLVGDEEAIVSYILNNFGWGGPENAEDLAEAKQEGDEMTIEWMKNRIKDDGLGMFDGAGGLFWVKDENGNVLIDVTEQWDIDPESLKEFVDLGEVQVSFDWTERFWNDVTRRLSLERDKDAAAWDKKYDDRMAKHFAKMDEELAKFVAESKKDENSQG